MKEHISTVGSILSDCAPSTVRMSSHADENCPHCQQPLEMDHLGYRHARLRHLVEHALRAASGFLLSDVPDRSFWEAAEGILDDTWADAALVAHLELFDVVNSLPPVGSEQDRVLGNARAWLRRRYSIPDY